MTGEPRKKGELAARIDWHANLGDFERAVDRVLRTIAFEYRSGAGADGEARLPIGEQGCRQPRRHKASTVNLPSRTRRYWKIYGELGRKTQEPLFLGGAPAAIRTLDPLLRRQRQNIVKCSK